MPDDPAPDPAVRALHRRLFRSGHGQVSEDEAAALAALIRRRRPRRVLEVGVASGLSTLVLHTALEATPAPPSTAPPRLLALDLDDRFYADESRPTGWMLLDAHDGAVPPGVRLRTGVTTVDLTDLPEASGAPFDLAFVDADHKHPWPALDALMVWPRLADGGLLLCHDLSLYRKPRSARGVGPKLLCDQIPAELRVHPAEAGDNLFGLVKAMTDGAFAARLADALLLPWTVRRLPEGPLAARITARLAEDYPGTPVADAFTEGLRRTRAMREGTA
ncbi:class I SAM-dependent methyltransferase [Roseospira visakhapatnamensis]|uniref:Putative O-methyltransferase YrrM n=1 Tax=Roseospira visakhapatnamensis TaxID=390880 RepID=A0A7W6RF70_9PROT|nr:class I SAM-dependent methyltransferase [Roseospira visakhapatnamensis]MBB4267207.1 putative O-methyltransferase YrrM [Roseospira visakhapatnamensis]